MNPILLRFYDDKKVSKNGIDLRLGEIILIQELLVHNPPFGADDSSVYGTPGTPSRYERVCRDIDLEEISDYKRELLKNGLWREQLGETKEAKIQKLKQHSYKVSEKVSEDFLANIWRNTAVSEFFDMIKRREDKKKRD